MTPLPSGTRLDQLAARVVPAHAADRPILRRVTAAVLALTVIHLTIWTLSSAIGGAVDTPWWLFTSGPAGLLLAGAWWLTAPVPDAP